ncbi:GNAT family N-acetyltransferase [Holophaga foetida]|uniref:GNAT family N-acetyltransferase n=1 Tax=Holophaga foetida TaxID=35839 RepID=UPI0002473B7E|nr:GNAT family N-acetyltransferase [Holophaga foetida]
MNRISQQGAGFVGIDDPRWSQALRRVPGDFFHLPGYMQASAQHEGGEPLLFLLDTGTHGMLLPLIKRPLEGFGKAFSGYYDATSAYGYPAPLYWGEGWRTLVPEMHAQMEAFLREERVVSLFLRLNPFFGAEDALLAPLGAVASHGPSVFMDLRDGEKSWLGINDKNRRFINKQMGQGYRVEVDQWQTIDVVIDAYYQSMRRLGAAPFYYFSKGYFELLVRETQPHFHLATSFSPDGEVTGGAFFSEMNGIIHYFLMGVLDAHRDGSPSKILVNAIRLWGIENGHSTLHLGGGLGARRDGLFDFKYRLSKQVTTFSTFRKILLPDMYHALAASQGRGGEEGDFFPIYRKPWEA